MTREELEKLDAEALRALAEKATPGPWSVCTDATGDTFIAAMADSAETICEFGAVDNDDGQVALEADAALIVELVNNLPTILAMAEELERVKAGAARYVWLRDHSCPPHNFYVSVPDEFHGIKYAASEVDAYIDAARTALGETK